jgi:hypothetical protein
MSSVQKSSCQENECEHRLMTIHEIINGSVNNLFLALSLKFSLFFYVE